ncbi:MAG: hypothetical protein ACRENE_15115 [Polyangiaceae bacterium]
MALFACPFCRDMFEKGEAAACPVCGVSLVAFEKLAASEEALAEDGTPVAPEQELLPRTYMGRGRGALVALALAGLVAFLLPWVRVTMPETVDYSGLEIAMRLGWAWGAGVAWFVLAPTVLSRRTIVQMRGARVAAAFLASVPGMTAAMLLARPPHGSHRVPLHFTFGPALYATLALSAAAVACAVLFGGRLDEIRLQHGTSRGQTVH